MPIEWKAGRPYNEYGEHVGSNHNMECVWSLSYAQFLTIPRVVIQSMPYDWQEALAALMNELDARQDWRPEKGMWRVQLDLTDYDQLRVDEETMETLDEEYDKLTGGEHGDEGDIAGLDEEQREELKGLIAERDALTERINNAERIIPPDENDCRYRHLFRDLKAPVDPELTPETWAQLSYEDRKLYGCHVPYTAQEMMTATRAARVAKGRALPEGDVC